MTCPACAKPFVSEEAKAVPYQSPGTPPAGVHLPTRILFCGSCGLGVAVPPFSTADEAIIYEQGQFWQKALPNKPRQNMRKLSLPTALAQSRWSFIKQAAAGRLAGRALRMLDIGSGQGMLGLVAAEDLSTALESYFAVEPDNGLQAELKYFWQRKGFTAPLAQAPSLEDPNVPTHHFDVVILSHVLEHLRSPAGMLAAVKPYLRESGVLFIEVPHQDYLFKEDVFPHELFFTRDSLRTLLEQAHWTIHSLESYGRDQQTTPFRKDASLILRMPLRLIGRLSGVIPAGWQRAFYRWAYGINDANPTGIWLRALVSPKNSL